MFTYKAKLLIAECKTAGKPFDNDYLYKLHSVADLVGGNYVRQVSITNSVQSEGRDEKFDNFCHQTSIRRISVITGEQLTGVGLLLQQQVGVTGRNI